MRKFTWCRQELAANCTLALNHYHVCIKSPSSSKVIGPSCFVPSLYMSFADFEPDKVMKTPAFAMDPVKGQEIINQCFTMKDAQELADWVDATEVGTTIIVNCEVGVSRSPAIVAAFRRFYGGDVEECFQKAYPNLHVANTLARVLGVSEFSEADYVKRDAGPILFT